MNCVFCQIIEGKIPSTQVYKDKKVVAFRDIRPLAPVHILIVPLKHIETLHDIPEDDLGLISHMISVACKIAAKESIDKKGYRVVINCGPEGGQIIPHLHMHLIGGARLSDRMA